VKEGIVWRERDELIFGSPTCARVLYLSVVRGKLFSSHDIQRVLLARHAAGAPIEVDHSAISHLLHDGFVPQPRTVYRDVFAISIDLSAKLAGSELVFERSFPFTKDKSPADGKPNPRLLLAYLAESVKAACKDSSNIVLTLSAGVDSTSVAVAAKEAGRDDVVCVTYGEPEKSDFEVNFARATCRRLGLRHIAHILDVGHTQLGTALINYAAAVPQPCADPASIAGISLIGQYATEGSVVLDGSGSDYYFWRPPKAVDLAKTWLGLGRIGAFRKLRSFIPMHYRGERILATPMELLLLHGAWLRFSETSRFYPDAVDTDEFWLREFAKGYEYDREERQHCLRKVYLGPAAYMLKTRNAALAVGAEARFPWTDSVVANYCFSLPEASRFDRRRRESKTIVRQMLREVIDYDADLVGKRPFLFGKSSFLRSHVAFCRDEILSCTLWSREIEATFDRLTQLLSRGCQTENALLSMLMVSLWFNHWIKGSMADWLRVHDRVA
jgi:asparagine synthetase B (glutamine-hydrolysing)